MRPSTVALWTMSFDGVPWTEARAAVRAAEEAGWRMLWLPESLGREVLSLATACLASSSRLVVGPATWNPMWKIELPTTRPTGSNPASVTSRNDW